MALRNDQVEVIPEPEYVPPVKKSKVWGITVDQTNEALNSQVQSKRNSNVRASQKMNGKQKFFWTDQIISRNAYRKPLWNP